MTSNDRSAPGNGVATATAEVRQSIADLDQMIAALRDEAEALLDRAASRMALVELARQAAETDPAPASVPQEAEAAAVAPVGDPDGATGQTPPAGASHGRHAAETPTEFDPTPYDPDEDDELADDEPDATQNPDPGGDASSVSEAAPVFGDAAAFDVAAAPAFEADPGSDASLPAFDSGKAVDAFGANDSDHTVLVEPDAADDAPDTESEGHVADVIEFTPREPVADAPAFGSLVPDFDPAKPPPPGLDAINDDTEGFRAAPLPADVETAFGTTPAEPTVDELAARAAEKRSNDGLEAIATSESTEIPKDWDGPADDDDAFDKFFSADVEPEPAQRWLLNE